MRRVAQALDKKIFGTLFFSIFAAVTGVGIVVPLLPVYAHDLGAGGLYIGLIFGAFSISRTIFLPYFGRVSDRRGRKPFIVAGLFSYALISVAFIFSKSVESLIILRFFQGIASAVMMPVIQAYVGDITPEGSEGFVMGMFNMSMFMGMSLGPLAGGVIQDRIGMDAAFLIMGILSMVGFFLSLFFLPPRRLEVVSRKSGEPASWRRILEDRVIAGLFIFRFVYTAAIGVIWGFLPVFAASEFDLNSSAIGVLLTLGVLISGSVQTPLGYYADRWNRKRMVLSGGVILILSVYSFTWATGFADMVISSVFFGIGGGISMPALMAIAVSTGAKSKAMGSIMALLNMAQSMGMLVGSLLAGVMMDLVALRQAYVGGALLMMLGTLLFVVLVYPRKLK